MGKRTCIMTTILTMDYGHIIHSSKVSLVDLGIEVIDPLHLSK